MTDSAQSVKVVLLGESSVGKTSIISQFTSNKFDPDCVTSLSAQFISKQIEFKHLKKTLKFDIWDTAGQEKYRALAKIFYKDAKIIILCYDIVNKKSFDEIKNYWYEQTKNNSDPDAIYALVANKDDLYQNQNVPDEEGKAFAKQINAIFQKTSALNAKGINNLFENLGKKYLNPEYDYEKGDEELKKAFEEKKKLEEEKKKNKGQKLDPTKVKNKGDKGKKCC